MININELIENKLEVIFSKHVLALILVCMIGLFLRLYFTRFEFPLESQDAFLYLSQAQQIAQGNLEGMPTTYGWQSFLAFFLLPFHFENNLGYMTVVRLVSIAVSVATIPVVYTLGRTILEKRYAILAAAFFGFDPNLIENSIFGISEPLFLLCGVLTILFILQDKTKSLVPAAIFAGFSLDVRLNGIVLFIILTIVCFTKNTTIKDKIRKFFLFLLFFVIAAMPFFIQSYNQSGSPFAAVFELTQEIQTQVPPSLDASNIGIDMLGKFKIAITEEFKHIFRISIPYLALFFPFGIISSLSNLDHNKKIILLTIIISLIIAIPQYTLSLEYRNLFFILPMFSIIAAYGIQYILSKNFRKNLFLVLLVAGTILLSYNMLRERNDIDLDLLKEKERFGEYVGTSFKGVIMGDLYTQIQHNLPNARYTTGGVGSITNDNLVLVGFGPPSKTVYDLIRDVQKLEVTHIVIDDVYDKRSPQLIDVFYSEERYPYLKKVFDSEENGYRKLRVKIFEIDYNRLE